MDGFVFLHGSSAGQSVFVPTNAPTSICHDIANKYFKGRDGRQAESSAKVALFVDLYKNTDQNIYCIYSFVNNECLGSDGRDGQYFALSIACKNVYIHPEDIYHMLSDAYSEILKTKRILILNNQKIQYVIPQFENEKELITNVLRIVEDAFYSLSNRLGKTIIDNNCRVADYVLWKGLKVNLDICNSSNTFENLCKFGRIYISEEYESLSQQIDNLKNQIKKLEETNRNLKQDNEKKQYSEKSKTQNEIERLNLQIEKKDTEIETLSSENTRYKETIEIVRKELDKYENISKSIHKNIGGKQPELQSKSNNEILKICLLFFILILSLLSALLNLGFFRNLSSPTEESDKKVKEIVANTTKTPTPIEQEETQVIPSSFVVSPQTIMFDANGGQQVIDVLTDGIWDAPHSPKDWIKIVKTDNEHLRIEADTNNHENDRSSTFIIETKTGGFEKQITITQKGKQITKTVIPIDYGIVVTDSSGKPLRNNDLVKNGETVYAEATKPNLKDGYGWKFHNCSGNDSKKNVKQVNVKIDCKKGNNIIISYGEVKEDGQRQRFYLKLDTSEEQQKEVSQQGSTPSTENDTSVSESVNTTSDNNTQSQL